VEAFLKKVLFASNGAKPSQDAGLLIRRLAEPGKISVTVNVCDSVEFAFPQEGWTYGMERKRRAQPQEVAETELANFQSGGFEADSHLGSGVPALQILERVEEGGYELVALGAGSTKWLDNLLLGSTSTRVLHSSEASVLIVHRFDAPSDKVRVLLATDRSEDSVYAVEELIGIADPKKVTVTVVSVADAVPTIQRLIPDGLPSEEIARYLQEAARKSADLAAGPLREAGFSVEVSSPTGDPVREILQLAKDVDLVVCGSNGMGGASRLLLGSVSDQLARLAPATLVCRKPASTE
jgi:nucleotide-binding universal stress UspA family protein